MSNTDSIRFLSSFDRSDRIAVLFLNRARKITRQRLITVQTAYYNAFQQLLHRENQEGFDIYLSMNPLSKGATGRTKRDIRNIRHLYLDCDEHGDEVVDLLLRDPRVPAPRSFFQTSDHKWHVIWRVEGFSLDLAEGTMRTLVREFGADPAATDSTRVLRWPGFLNHKYQPPFLVRLVRYIGGVCTPAAFHAFPPSADVRPRTGVQYSARNDSSTSSQSERDWAWTLEQLRQGRSPQSIIEELASLRPDKPNPLYYATLTVNKAIARRQPSQVRSRCSADSRP